MSKWEFFGCNGHNRVCFSLSFTGIVTVTICSWEKVPCGTETDVYAKNEMLKNTQKLKPI